MKKTEAREAGGTTAGRVCRVGGDADGAGHQTHTPSGLTVSLCLWETPVHSTEVGWMQGTSQEN